MTKKLFIANRILMVGDGKLVEKGKIVDLSRLDDAEIKQLKKLHAIIEAPEVEVATTSDIPPEVDKAVVTTKKKDNHASC